MEGLKMTSCNDALAETWIQVRATQYALYLEVRDGYVGIWIDENYRTHVAILSLNSDVHKDTVIRSNLTSWIH